jgi:hypothetical protein
MKGQIAVVHLNMKRAPKAQKRNRNHIQKVGHSQKSQGDVILEAKVIAKEGGVLVTEGEGGIGQNHTLRDRGHTQGDQDQLIAGVSHHEVTPGSN